MWIILLSNSEHKVQAFGTKTGRMYVSEQAAKRAAKTMENSMDALDTGEEGMPTFLVLPIHAMPERLARTRKAV